MAHGFAQLSSLEQQERYRVPLEIHRECIVRERTVGPCDQRIMDLEFDGLSEISEKRAIPTHTLGSSGSSHLIYLFSGSMTLPRTSV